MNSQSYLKNDMLENTVDSNTKPSSQYNLWQILAIWAAVTLPMALLAWVVAPVAIPAIPLNPGITYWLLTIAGMVWQFLVSLAVLSRELGTLRWSAIRQRTWLQMPRDPITNKPSARLFWWLAPALLFSAGINLGLGGPLEAVMARILPAVKPAAYMDMSQLAAPEFQGRWWLLGLAVVSITFNYFLGEEFLFRGVLLPKMEGVFGKYDWLANAVLFSFYHLHKPWSMLTQLLGNLAFTWPSRRFRSNWMAVVVHGVEGFLFLAIVLGAILGLGGR